jgi:hypothetical protein
MFSILCWRRRWSLYSKCKFSTFWNRWSRWWWSRRNYCGPLGGIPGTAGTVNTGGGGGGGQRQEEQVEDQV